MTYEIVNIPWPFQDPPTTEVFVSRFVAEGEQPLRYVCRNHDGTWEFLCGTTSDSPDDFVLKCLVDVARQFPTAGALARLPVGWIAEWNGATSEWEIAPADIEA